MTAFIIDGINFGDDQDQAANTAKQIYIGSSRADKARTKAEYLAKSWGTPKPATIKAVTFLKLWPSYPTLTAIHLDAAGATTKIETKAFPKSDWQAVASWVEARQGKANLYFLVNPTREPK